MPCLKTKVFWAPIAIIREIPRKNPVKKASITVTYKPLFLKYFFPINKNTLTSN